MKLKETLMDGCVHMHVHNRNYTNVESRCFSVPSGAVN